MSPQDNQDIMVFSNDPVGSLDVVGGQELLDSRIVSPENSSEEISQNLKQDHGLMI